MSQLSWHSYNYRAPLEVSVIHCQRSRMPCQISYCYNVFVHICLRHHFVIFRLVSFMQRLRKISKVWQLKWMTISASMLYVYPLSMTVFSPQFTKVYALVTHFKWESYAPPHPHPIRKPLCEESQNFDWFAPLPISDFLKGYLDKWSEKARAFVRIVDKSPWYFYSFSKVAFFIEECTFVEFENVVKSLVEIFDPDITSVVF